MSDGTRCCDSETLRIDSGWLVEVHNHCTIGCEPPYGHQPGCGLVPIVRLNNLDGWPDRAKAWDEGYSTGVIDQARWEQDPDHPDGGVRNPYQ
jgi:hypothetical protein